MATRIYKTPFAATGDKETLATADQPDGKVSLQAGWTPDYELPNDDANYRPVGRAEMNGIIGEITEGLGDVQLHGFATWQAIDGGWPLSARVTHGGVCYRSLVEGNTVEPSTSASEWIRLASGLATSAEVIAGLDDTKTVTPAGLASLTSTSNRRGLIRLAVTPEVIAGNDDTKAVTPAGLAQLTATSERRGLIEIATDTETAEGTDFMRAVTPGALSARNATDIRTGLIKIATSALAQGLTDDASAITPKKLADAFKGANWNPSSPGYVRLPNGIIIQWGAASGFNSYTIAFPIAFPSGPLMAPLAVCIGGDDYDSPNAAWAEASNFPTKTTAKIFVYKPGPTGGAVSTARAICWICIGT